MEAFKNCADYCRYGRKYSHDIDFQKLKKFGICKFELKAKGRCKNSDKFKLNHQTPKPLYRQKTTAGMDTSPSYTKCSKETPHSKHHISNNLPKSLNEGKQTKQAENHFLKQMKDITAFYKMQLMEVTKLITKN